MIRRKTKRDETGQAINKDGKPRKKRAPHSPETRAKISERRKARSATNPPRNASQSNKSKSLYDELKKDYSKKRISKKYPKKVAEVLEWLEKNKSELGHLENEKFRDNIFAKNREMGIYTEFEDMYNSVYMNPVSDMLFENDNSYHETRSYDPYDFVECLDEGKSISEELWG